MQIPELGFFKLMDERIGRWATTTVVVLWATASAVFFIAVILTFGVRPIVAFGLGLAVSQSLPSRAEFIATLLSGLIFAGFVAVVWRLMVVPTVRRLDKSFRGLDASVRDYQREVTQRLDEIDGRVRGLESSERKPMAGY